MDLKERRQLDVGAKMAKVRARAQPWRATFAAVLALAAAAISRYATHLATDYTANHPVHPSPPLEYQAVAYGTAIGFVLFASAATLGLASKARDVLLPRVGSAHAAMVRIVLTLIGAVITLITTLALFRLNVSQLVLGGTLLVAVIGIASQQTLANLFAGLVLLVSRPFGVGDYARFQSGTLGDHEGTVIEIGLTYVRLDTTDGVISMPNTQVLNAVVGPVKSSRPEPFPDR